MTRAPGPCQCGCAWSVHALANRQGGCPNHPSCTSYTAAHAQTTRGGDSHGRGLGLDPKGAPAVAEVKASTADTAGAAVNPARRQIDLAMSENDWTATVIGTQRDRGLARTLGWTCLHIHDSRREVVNQTTGERRLVGDKDAAGLPDWLLIRERILWVELKRERGIVRPAQQHVIDTLRRAGGEAYLWRPSDWPEVVVALTGRGRPTRPINIDEAQARRPTRSIPDVDHRRGDTKGVTKVNTGGAT